MIKEYSGRANIKMICGDCMDFMRDCEPKQFELAIVDPPYGIGEHGGRDRRIKKVKR